MKIIDVNASWGFWPAQRFTARRLQDLDAMYQEAGIDEVWLSAVESILFPEPDTFDTGLLTQLSGYSRFRPVKVVNPVLANWRSSCLEFSAHHPVAALKLYPNYHGYTLQTPEVAEVCTFAMEQALPILIAMRVNDERNQPGYMEVRGVPAADIADLSLRHPDTRICCLCAYMHELATLAKGNGNLLVELSFLDDADTLGTASRRIPIDRIVFGSHAPFLNVLPAALKMAHAALSGPDRAAIAAGNLTRTKYE